MCSTAFTQAQAPRRRLDPLNVLILSAWCGLAGGLLEVGARVLCRWIDPTNRLYGLSRHYVWLTPLSTLFLFGRGIVSGTGNEGLATARRVVLHAFHRFLGCAAGADRGGPADLPGGLGDRGSRDRVAGGSGFSSGTRNGLRRRLMLSFPALLGSVLVLATLVFGGDWLKRRLEASRPLPSADSPNVLLIVLDTVRADRLSLYGYKRPTTPALERLARRGIRFDEARADGPLDARVAREPFQRSLAP